MTTSPDTILAAAEDERHTLLAQAARNHLSNVRAETRRYEEDIRRIESVFQLRIQGVSQVPAWITENRKADIATALRIIDTASDENLSAWFGQTSAGRAGVSPEFTRLRLARAASEPALVYDAWITAREIMQASRPEARPAS